MEIEFGNPWDWVRDRVDPSGRYGVARFPDDGMPADGDPMGRFSISAADPNATSATTLFGQGILGRGTSPASIDRAASGMDSAGHADAISWNGGAPPTGGGPNRSASDTPPAVNPGAVDRWQGLKDAAHMTADWAFGTGPANRVFGPGAEQVAEMRNAPGVMKARDYFYAKNAKQIENGGLDHLDKVDNYAARFGFGDLLTNGSPTQQFVGSYGVRIDPADKGENIKFTLTNDSSFKSLGYGLAPAWERASFGPGGNMRQTYTWVEPLRRK